MDTGPLGTFILASRGPGRSQLVHRAADGVWKVALELPKHLGQAPQAHLAVGESRAIALLGPEDRAISAAYSQDGEIWERAEPRGFPAGVDLSDLTATHSGFVAIGDVARVPGIWTSVDGLVWTEEKRWDTSRVRLSGLAAGPEATVVVGRRGRRTFAWASTGGGDWFRRDVQPPISIVDADVVWAGGRFVLTGNARDPGDFGLGPVVMTSEDGLLWEELQAKKRPDMLLEAATSGGVQLAALGRTFYPERHRNNCLLNGCGDATSKVFSLDGQGWLERRVPFEAPYGRVGRVLEVDGALLLIVSQGSDLEVWREGPQVSAVPAVTPEIPQIPWEWVDQDDNPSLEIGVEYAIRLGGHCGITWTTELDDRYWWVVDGWEYPSGVDYLNLSHYGTIELVEPDRLVFRVLDEVYAEYEPRDGPFYCN